MLCAAASGLLLWLQPALAADNRAFVYWPDSMASSDDDLEIVDLRLRVHCGEIKEVGDLPDDWNGEVVNIGPGSWELRASAVHNASHLRDLQALQGVIAVQPDLPDCFAVSARVVSLNSEVALSDDEILLRRRNPHGGPSRPVRGHAASSR